MAVVLGQRIRQLRKQHKLTQAQLAKRARLSRTSITNMEAGRQTPDLWTLFCLSEALQTTASELIAE